MNNKYIFTAIAIVIVLIIGLFIYNSSQNNNNVSNSNQSAANLNSETNTNTTANDVNTNTNATNANANTSTQTSQSQPLPETKKPDGNDVAVTEVTYNGTTFSPATVSIKSGDIVIFKNISSGGMWPASDPHPTHTNYPEFDAKTSIASGQSYQFKFTKVGTWGYHNHLDHTVTGTIIVK